jgi:membrane protein DedA with SNARE-associated domain
VTESTGDANADRTPAPHPSIPGPVHHDRVPAAVRRSVLVAALALYATGFFGSSIAPAWIENRPEAVLAMSSRNRNLFASVPFIELHWYLIIGFARVFTVGIVLYLLGRWYGRRAIDWTEGQVGEMPPIYRWFQKGVDKAGWLLVILMPGSNLVCLMAGHRLMAPARFAAYLFIGVWLKLGVLWWGGNVFEDQIRAFLDWIRDYQWWVVGGLFALSFLQSSKQARRSIPDIVEEIERPEDTAGEPTR